MSSIKTILITGASKGIGVAVLTKAIAKQFKCIVVSRSYSDIYAHNLVEHIKADLADRSQLQDVCKQIQKQKINYLVNNAGAGSPCGFESLEYDQYDSEMTLNLLAPIMLTKAVLPQMKAINYGRIVQVSSTASRAGVPNLYVYGAAKAGLNNTVQALAKAMNGFNIAVNAVCPGGVDTEMANKGRMSLATMQNLPAEEYSARMANLNGLNRLLNSSEIADVIMQLLEAETPSLNGQCVNVCGTLQVN